MTTPQKHTDGRAHHHPRGKVMGGSSCLNWMLYVRCSRHDYDQYAEQGCTGWDYDSVLPYFKKSEHWCEEANGYRATGGPLHVTRIKQPSMATRVWIEAAKQRGLRYNDDYNASEQEGVAHAQVCISGGERHNTARAFLYPVEANMPNLTIRTRAHVLRINIEDKRAVGVNVFSSAEVQHYTIRAKREVVVCAGAFQSPHLLQLSGIGEHIGSGTIGGAKKHVSSVRGEAAPIIACVCMRCPFMLTPACTIVHAHAQSCTSLVHSA